MIGLIVHMDSGTRRWASDDIYSRGNFYEGRILNPSASSAHVSRWLPMSTQLSRSTFGLRDADGELATLFQKESVSGRQAEVIWIGDEEDIQLFSGVVRQWKGGPGSVSLPLDDPALLRFGAALTPILSDIEPGADEDLAGNLVPQVFGRATRLPVAGGVVRDGQIELVASLGDREVTNVRYDGTLLDKSTWEALCNCSADPAHTIIRVSGDTSRDPSNFEWSGGETSYTTGGMIQSVLRTNGVLETEIDSDSFTAFDALLVRRGLMADRDDPEGSIVVIDREETISTILQRIQNSWGALVYIGAERKFRIGLPVYETGTTEVTDIPSSLVEFKSWSIESPEGTTEWEVQSHRAWSRNSFNIQQTVHSYKNLDAFGAAIKGRAIQQWYTRGHSALNFAEDRLLLEQWDFFRSSLTVHPATPVRTGDFVRIVGSSATLQIPDDIWFVDGISIVGSGMKTRRKLSLSPVIGVRERELVATAGTETFTLDAGVALDEDLDALYS